MNARSWVVLGLSAAISLAAPLQARTAEPATETAAAAPVLEPGALAALDKMGAELRALRQFSLVSDTSVEIVLDDGQKIELDGTLTYKVIKPDQLFVDIASDRRHRQIFFDGKDFTINSPRLNMYASTPVQARTLAELATNAAEKYGIEFPLVDMFFWGTDHATKDLITSARHVGSATLDGQKVQHYAYTQENVHWQVWITDAGNLPKKFVITSQEDPAQPQYRANLHWDTQTPVVASALKFTPAKDAQRIVLASGEALAAEAETEN